MFFAFYPEISRHVVAKMSVIVILPTDFSEKSAIHMAVAIVRAATAIIVAKRYIQLPKSQHVTAKILNTSNVKVAVLPSGLKGERGITVHAGQRAYA